MNSALAFTVAGTLAYAAACAARELPATMPTTSPASTQATEAPAHPVTRALHAEPPLPSEDMQGWEGLQRHEPSEGSSDPHAHDPHAHVRPAASHPAQDEASAPGSDPDSASYTCPMHPEVVSDKPGRCPKCGMALEKKK